MYCCSEFIESVSTWGNVQYRNSSGTSWKSWSLVTAFSPSTNSDLAIDTSLITTKPGTFTSLLQICSKAFLWNTYLGIQLDWLKWTGIAEYRSR